MKITRIIFTVFFIILTVQSCGTVDEHQDRSAPLITTFTTPANCFNDVVPLTIIAEDNVKVTGYYLSESEPGKAQPQPPSPGISGWETELPAVFQLDSRENKTCLLNLWVKDGAGNVSDPETVSINYYTEANPQIDVAIKPFTVKDNHFVDQNGNIAELHGVALPELIFLEWGDNLNSGYFTEIKNWGANLIRVAITPWEWLHNDRETYLGYIDYVVEQAGQNGLYVIIDLHPVGNLVSQVFPVDDWDNVVYAAITLEEAKEFWHTMAKRYKDEPAVAFYELFNEPLSGNVWGTDYGDVSWREWRLYMEELADVIRREDSETIILAAGFGYAWDLQPVLDDPVRGINIGYATHPYARHGNTGWVQNWSIEVWDEHIGDIAKKYPVVATEFGYMLTDEPHYDPEHDGTYAVEDRAYLDQLIQYLDQRYIPWTAFCFDTKWHPSLILDFENYTPTQSGKHVREILSSY